MEFMQSNRKKPLIGSRFSRDFRFVKYCAFILTLTLCDHRRQQGTICS